MLGMCTDEEESRRVVMKLGEWPPFGERVSDQLLDLLGSDRDLFLKGKTAENQGLGIGASSYYRRVVENQREALFEEITKTAKLLKVSDEVIANLDVASREWRFDRSVREIKDL